jgi:hypothetical protein
VPRQQLLARIGIVAVEIDCLKAWRSRFSADLWQRSGEGAGGVRTPFDQRQILLPMMEPRMQTQRERLSADSTFTPPHADAGSLAGCGAWGAKGEESRRHLPETASTNRAPINE